MPKYLVDPDVHAVPVHALASADFAGWLKSQDSRTQAWVKGSGFKGEAGKTLLLPAPDGDLESAIYILSDEPGPWAWSALFDGLAKTATYTIVSTLDGQTANDAALGFVLASYRYDRYRSDTNEGEAAGPLLVWPEATHQAIVREAYGATKLVRDLVNTPASDLGPEQLAKAAQDLAEASGASYSSIVGVDLIREGFPAIYAVGRGAEDSRAPRLVDFSWGSSDAPKVTLIGKGVCFDTGGLDIKSTAGMKLMKKDMGGAAHVLALASMIIAHKLDVRLRVLIPAVENSVSNGAMRPLDVVATRKGLTVEIGNTDAEGRVILADALSLAGEEKPDLLVDFATLTGAARVALGTDLPALFCNDDDLAATILAAGQKTADPLWRLPLYQPYKKQMVGKVADLRNDSDSPYAGAILAGLFLESFVEPGISWVHVDLMAWNTQARPGRPEGGEALALRALFDVLQNRYAH